MKPQWKSYCLIVVLIIFGCTSSSHLTLTPGTELIYSCDFESSVDTLGWRAFGDIILFPDSPPSGGRGCLLVEGADSSFSHATKTLGILSEDGKIIIRFQAKSLYHSGGQVCLTGFHMTSGDQGVSRGSARGECSSDLDTVWHAYADTVEFLNGDDLRIGVMGNVSPYSPLLVDNIEVLKILRGSAK